MKNRLAVFALVLAASLQPLFAQSHQPVLMISIDGLKPEYVTQADKYRLRIPTLRRIMADGTYADGVTGVVPTVTYPSHTTLVTGVWPAEHGILNNQIFDPEHKFTSNWYWYSSEIQVPTLWDVAHAAGIRTASVSWPVTADNASIDDDIPEYWRTANAGLDTTPQDRLLMNAISRPPGSLAEMQSRLGPYMKGNNTTPAGDRIRTTFALDILKRQKPGFMTVHLSSLDEAEHESGPFSAESNETLETLDGYVAELVAQAMKNDPSTVIAIVSDHGFAPIHDTVNLYIPFIEAGLITASKDPATGALKVASWKAQPWLGGCLGVIMLQDPHDDATRKQVQHLIEKLAADPANGIERIMTGEEVKQLGGFPDAAFVIALRPGFSTGAALSGPLLTPTPGRGTHGYLPSHPEMRSSLFLMGKGITTGHDLGVIDMRQIAPTVAEILAVKMPSAKEAPLQVRSH